MAGVGGLARTRQLDRGNCECAACHRALFSFHSALRAGRRDQADIGARTQVPLPKQPGVLAGWNVVSTMVKLLACALARFGMRRSTAAATAQKRKLPESCGDGGGAGRAGGDLEPRATVSAARCADPGDLAPMRALGEADVNRIGAGIDDVDVSFWWPKRMYIRFSNEP